MVGPEASSAGVAQIPNGKLLDWVAISFDVARVKITWERTDKFITAYLDGSVKKDLHVVHVAYPDYRRLSMNVQVITFEPEELPSIVDISIDHHGRNYAVFWSKSKKDLNYSCNYYKVTFKNKVIVNKLSHSLP